jgi:sporulation protein YlmC with PRC-barrel domain
MEYGAQVYGRNGVYVGTVNRLVRNLWTGEVSKFMVKTDLADRDLFLSPEDILEDRSGSLTLKTSVDELKES